MYVSMFYLHIHYILECHCFLPSLALIFLSHARKFRHFCKMWEIRGGGGGGERGGGRERRRKKKK